MKKNDCILLTYIGVIGSLMAVYLLTVGIRGEIYFYPIFWMVQLLIYSTLMVALEVKEDKGNKWYEVGRYTLAIAPILYLTTFLQEVEGSIFIPIMMQYVYGVALLGLTQTLKKRLKDNTWWVVYSMQMIWNVGALAFIYLYYLLKNTVIVSLLDKRIPLPLYIHPFLAIGGVTSMQVGTTNYIGNLPIGLFFLFWIGIALLTGKKRQQGQKGVKDSEGKGN